MTCTCRPSAECPEHLGLTPSFVVIDELVHIECPCPPADNPDKPPLCKADDETVRVPE